MSIRRQSCTPVGKKYNPVCDDKIQHAGEATTRQGRFDDVSSPVGCSPRLISSYTSNSPHETTPSRLHLSGLDASSLSPQTPATGRPSVPPRSGPRDVVTPIASTPLTIRWVAEPSRNSSSKGKCRQQLRKTIQSNKPDVATPVASSQPALRNLGPTSKISCPTSDQINAGEVIALMQRSSGGAAILRRLLNRGSLDPNQTLDCEELTRAAVRMTMLQGHFAALHQKEHKAQSAALQPRPKSNTAVNSTSQPMSTLGQAPLHQKSSPATASASAAPMSGTAAAAAVATSAVRCCWPLLCAACFWGEPSHVDTLLRAGADPCWTSPYGLGPLSFAVANPTAAAGERLAVVQSLLSKLRLQYPQPPTPPIKQAHQHQELLSDPPHQPMQSIRQELDTVARVVAAWPPATEKCGPSTEAVVGVGKEHVTETKMPDGWWLVLPPLVIFLLQEESRAKPTAPASSANGAAASEGFNVASMSALNGPSCKPSKFSTGPGADCIIKATSNGTNGTPNLRVNSDHSGAHGDGCCTSSREGQLVDLLVQHGALDARLLRPSSLLTLAALVRRSAMAAELLAPALLRWVEEAAVAEADAEGAGLRMNRAPQAEGTSARASTDDDMRRTGTTRSESVGFVGGARAGCQGTPLMRGHLAGRILAALLQHALVQPPVPPASLRSAAASNSTSTEPVGNASSGIWLLRASLRHGLDPSRQLWPGGVSVADLVVDAVCPQPHPLTPATTLRPTQGPLQPPLSSPRTQAGPTPVQQPLSPYQLPQRPAPTVPAASPIVTTAASSSRPLTARLKSSSPCVVPPDPTLPAFMRLLLGASNQTALVAGAERANATVTANAISTRISFKQGRASGGMAPCVLAAAGNISGGGGGGLNSSGCGRASSDKVAPLLQRLAVRMGSQTALSALELLLDTRRAQGFGFSSQSHELNAAGVPTANLHSATSRDYTSLDSTGCETHSQAGPFPSYPTFTQVRSGDYTSTAKQGEEVSSCDDACWFRLVSNALADAHSVRNLDAIRAIAEHLSAAEPSAALEAMMPGSRCTAPAAIAAGIRSGLGAKGRSQVTRAVDTYGFGASSSSSASGCDGGSKGSKVAWTELREDSDVDACDGTCVDAANSGSMLADIGDTPVMYDNTYSDGNCSGERSIDVQAQGAKWSKIRFLATRLADSLHHVRCYLVTQRLRNLTSTPSGHGGSSTSDAFQKASITTTAASKAATADVISTVAAGRFVQAITANDSVAMGAVQRPADTAAGNHGVACEGDICDGYNYVPKPSPTSPYGNHKNTPKAGRCPAVSDVTVTQTQRPSGGVPSVSVQWSFVAVHAPSGDCCLMSASDVRTDLLLGNNLSQSAPNPDAGGPSEPPPCDLEQGPKVVATAATQNLGGNYPHVDYIPCSLHLSFHSQHATGGEVLKAKQGALEAGRACSRDVAADGHRPYTRGPSSGAAATAVQHALDLSVELLCKLEQLQLPVRSRVFAPLAGWAGGRHGAGGGLSDYQLRSNYGGAQVDKLGNGHQREQSFAAQEGVEVVAPTAVVSRMASSVTPGGGATAAMSMEEIFMAQDAR